jgi:hypothetical protein
MGIATGVVVAASAPYLVPIALIMGGAATTAFAVHGAWNGARSSFDGKNAREALSKAVAATALQDGLGEQVAKFAQDIGPMEVRLLRSTGPTADTEQPTYGALALAGVDTVVEVAVTEAAFAACTGDFSQCRGNLLRDAKRGLTLSLKIKARLVRVSDGKTLESHQFRFESPQREADRWLESDGALVTRELERAIAEIAERIVDEVFLVVPVQLELAQVRPLHMDVARPCFAAPSILLADSRAKGQSIHLHWKSFPQTHAHGRIEPELLAKIRDVSYEVRIWETELSQRTEMAYERKGLMDNEYIMAEALNSSDPLIWSARARFNIGKRAAATRWVTTCEDD